MIIEGKPCEVCGLPATCINYDMTQGEPVRDTEGRLWATWDQGDAHYHCNDHAKKLEELMPPFAAGYVRLFMNTWNAHNRRKS